MILREWRKFKGWAVLEAFLLDGRRTYLKELSRTLAISPRTAQTYLKLYEMEGVLEKEKIGNTIVYTLESNAITKELKKTYLLLRIAPYIKRFLSDNPQIVSLALYGSAARGEYDVHSDIDLLAISASRAVGLSEINRLEKELGMEVRLEIVSVGEWRRLAAKKDSFYSSVTNSSITLHGALP
jgi:predicted nucleotidyltransferase